MISYACPPGNYAGPRATPVLDGGRVYGLSRQGHAFCLDAEKGTLKWKKNLFTDFGARDNSWGLAGSPLVVGDVVVYNASSHGIALDKTSGKKVWASPGGGSGYATPVHFQLDGKDVVAVFGKQAVAVVDLKTGRKLSSFTWKTKYSVNAADPVYFDGKLFITSGYNRGCALLNVTGGRLRKAWENRNLKGHFSSPIYFDGHLFGVDGNTGGGKLRCLDPATGETKWERSGGHENLMIADGKILVIDKKGILTVAEADPSGYKEIARAVVLPGRSKKWTAPVLVNGLIYCRDGAGTLVCVDVR